MQPIQKITLKVKRENNQSDLELLVTDSSAGLSANPKMNQRYGNLDQNLFENVFGDSNISHDDSSSKQKSTSNRMDHSKAFSRASRRTRNQNLVAKTVKVPASSSTTSTTYTKNTIQKRENSRKIF